MRRFLKQRILVFIVFSTIYASVKVAVTIYDSFTAFGPFDSDPVTPSSCQRPVLELWTKHPNAARRSAIFPSCKKIIRAILDDSNEVRGLLAAVKSWTIPDPHDDQSMLQVVSNCTRFRRIVDFQEKPMSKEEEGYPLAYVFVPSRNLAQAVRLFRMLYHPQNAYCITYDTTSKEDYKKAIIAMASCFPSNVYLNPKPKDIVYSTFSILSSVMDCLDVLRKSHIKWRYVQIVSWNDFPLKTNQEMVKIFKTLNGSQDCELRYRSYPPLALYKHGGVVFASGHIPKPIAPAGVTFYEGSFATSMSREFVHFMFTDPASVKLYRYLNGTQFPDEFYWSALIYNVHLNAPGNFPGQCVHHYMDDVKPYVSRFQMWYWDQPYLLCHGFIERFSCVFGSKDLPMLMSRKELVAHKIYEHHQPALLYCLEEWYWRKVCTGEPSLSMKYYKNLPSVVYHNLSPKEKQKFICEFSGRSVFE